MPEPDDQQLLGEFARANSEAAFAGLVERHVNLVYSTALRFTSNPHIAEEISQAVFIILARKAPGLRRGTVLSGWLYQTARLTSANFVKHEVRRQRREQEAYMQSTLDAPGSPAWEEIAPLLDEAMGGLGETDRNAVVLRFFENKTAREVAAELKMTEAAAHKRTHRALEKLRAFFTKRGVASTSNIIAGAISANSIQPAPAALAKAATMVALAKGASASGSTLALVKGGMKVMAWTKAKTTIAAVAVTLLVAGGTGVIVTETVHAVRVAHFPDIQGTWEGVMLLDDPGVANGEASKTHVVLKLVKRHGIYTATTDWIETGRRDLPMGKIVYDYPSLQVPLHALRGEIWNLKINRNATQMTLDYAIHIIQPEKAVLTRTAAPDKVAEPLTADDFAPSPGSDLQGYWKGAIGTGADAVPVDLKIAGQPDGTFQAEADSPGADGQPITVTYSRPAVQFARASGAGMFKGQINDAGTEISGKWIQDGQSVPAVAKRADYQAEHVQDALKDYSFGSPNDLQGHWRGVWIAVFNGGKTKIPIRMALDIAKMPDGSYSATMASVDQFGHDAPIAASDFQYSPPGLKAEWKSAIGAFGSGNGIIPRYEGELERGKIVGTWYQSGGGFALDFERQN
jgi:RNA polymerase sigma factor (sigma-70 family)